MHCKRTAQGGSRTAKKTSWRASLGASTPLPAQPREANITRKPFISQGGGNGISPPRPGGVSRMPTGVDSRGPPSDPGVCGPTAGVDSRGPPSDPGVFGPTPGVDSREWFSNPGSSRFLGFLGWLLELTPEDSPATPGSAACPVLRDVRLPRLSWGRGGRTYTGFSRWSDAAAVQTLIKASVGAAPSLHHPPSSLSQGGGAAAL